MSVTRYTVSLRVSCTLVYYYWMKIKPTLVHVLFVLEFPELAIAREVLACWLQGTKLVTWYKTRKTGGAFVPLFVAIATIEALYVVNMKRRQVNLTVKHSLLSLLHVPRIFHFLLDINVYPLHHVSLFHIVKWCRIIFYHVSPSKLENKEEKSNINWNLVSQ